MPELQPLRNCLLSVAALICIPLSAQDLRVAVLEPVGDKEVQAQVGMVRNVFVETVVNTKGFQVIDRARTDQILKEHKFQRNGLVSPREAREMGKMLGVDFICTSEVKKHEDELEISSSMIDIVTGEVIGSASDMVEKIVSREIRDTSKELMARLLGGVNTKVATGFGRDAGGGRGSGSGSVAMSPMLDGLAGEIRNTFTGYRGNSDWNANKPNYTVEVDLSGVDVKGNRQFGAETFYVVSGKVAIIVKDAKTGSDAFAEVQLEQITEMTKDMIKRKIKDQINVESLVRALVRDLE
jgi:TolB-like protein